MSDLHIHEFFHDAARIVVSLFRVFPRPVPIYAEDICGPDEPDEYGLHSHRYQACFATMLWLGEEGYLRYDQPIRQDAIDQAVLTGRCFNALIAPTVAVADPDLPKLVSWQRSTLAFALEDAMTHKDQTLLQEHFPLLVQVMTEGRQGA